MFVVGDSIERSIDGSWFLGEIQAVFPPTDTVSGECIYNIFYNDIGNTETDVPESELRLSETSAKENDETSNEMLPLLPFQHMQAYAEHDFQYMNLEAVYMRQAMKEELVK